jgi:hypothetical protein
MAATKVPLVAMAGESAGSDDKYARWINAKTGTSTDGTDDYCNELKHHGLHR